MGNSRVKSETNRVLETIKSIVASRDVDQFLVGVTTENPTTRISSYRREGFEHFAALAFLSNREDALAVERAIFEACCDDKTLYRKYHEAKRDKAYHPSGGQSVGRKLVYIAWWSK